MVKPNAHLMSVPAGARRVIAVLCLAAVTACAVPSGVGYSPKGDEETFVVQTIKGMADALNAGEVDRFMSKVSTGYYKGYAQLEKRILSAMVNRVGFSLKVTVEKIEFEDPKIYVNLSWKESWLSKATTTTENAQGRSRLVFMKTMGVKLIDQAEETLFGF